MRRGFLAVWYYVWPEIWHRLESHKGNHEDLFVELLAPLGAAVKNRPLENDWLTLSNDLVASRELFRKLQRHSLKSEFAFISFLEDSYEVMLDMFGEKLAKRYASIVKAFIARHNLRYQFSKPFAICPSLDGVFSSFIDGLRTVAEQDADFRELLDEFEEAFRDLRRARNENNIKTCIQKNVNLLEGLGKLDAHADVRTFNRICDQIGTWPHEGVREAIKQLYWFTCDYPGLRHAGTPANRIRRLETRDAVALPFLLLGFSAYLTNRLDHDKAFGGV